MDSFWNSQEKANTTAGNKCTKKIEMEKKGKKTNWKAEDSAPMPTKGRKGAHFRNQTTNSQKNRFPLTTIIMAIILLGIIAFFLLFVEGLVSNG